MDRKAFESLVAQAVDDLPQEFQDNLENVNIVVQDWPTRRQLAGQRSRGRLGLLGLYEGVPQTARGQSYNLVLPDRITLFRKPIEATCRNREEVRQLVQDVLRHEIAHHFGTGEERLQEIERHRRNRNQSPKDG
ncbi:MAG: metallopeptidase family protein [Chloroflexi bacterium]|nr:metallopeptidase family protein [Chloroflexota bacterium]